MPVNGILCGSKFFADFLKFNLIWLPSLYEEERTDRDTGTGGRGGYVKKEAEIGVVLLQVKGC
jgi:hypothetical protein